MSTPEISAPEPGILARLWRFEYRNELIALFGLMIAVQFFPRTMPFGLYVLGLGGAATITLHAVAIVLVYRANKFINFSQLQLGLAAGTIFTGLVQGQILLRILNGVCGCLAAPGPLARGVNFVIAMIVGIAFAALINYIAYHTLVRRFTKSPRLMLTLVTVFAGQALAGFLPTVTGWLIPEQIQRRAARVPTAPPFDFTWQIDIFARLRFGDVLIILAALASVIGISLYLRRSDTGVAIRASAESPARAETLGVNVMAVTSRVWIMSGLLAGIAGVVGAFGSSAQFGGARNTVNIPVDQLVLILAVAVIARFKSLWMVGLGAFVLGFLEIAVQYAFSSTSPLDFFIVFLVGGLLLLQRYQSTRADREEIAGFEITREVRPIPRELRSLPQVAKTVRLSAFVGSAVLLGLPWALSASNTTLLAVFFIYAIVGLSLLVLTGWAGQMSLGQFGFAAIGAWAAASSRLPFLFALLLGGLAGAVAAVLVGIPALKLRGLHLAISTLAFSVSARAMFIDEKYFGRFLPESLNRPKFLGMDFDDARIYYYFMMVMVTLVVLMVVGLRRTRTGRVLIAIRSNEATAQSFGINVLRARLSAFAISGFLAALAGALFAFHQRSVTPESFTADQSLQMFLFSVIGGLGGVAGPLIGFTFMSMLTFFSTNPLIQYAAAGTGALLLMIAAPGGLAQVFYEMRDSALRRLAFRMRIPVPSLMGDRKAHQLTDRAMLEATRGKGSDDSINMQYELPQQWALSRFGRTDAQKERVGG